MSVLIKGMKMPKGCLECPCVVNLFFCKACGCRPITDKSSIKPTEGGVNISRPEWCPLIEIPEKHGRLVDADALHTLFENQWHYLQCLNWDENPTAEAKQTGINWCINTLHDDAPTIIEAEGDEE